MCPKTETFTADADKAKCLNMVKQLGWTSKKVPGYSWELYCPVCSKDPNRRPVAKGERDARPQE
jgi:hypothetical protein